MHHCYITLNVEQGNCPALVFKFGLYLFVIMEVGGSKFGPSHSELTLAPILAETPPGSCQIEPCIVEKLKDEYPSSSKYVWQNNPYMNQAPDVDQILEKRLLPLPRFSANSSTWNPPALNDLANNDNLVCKQSGNSEGVPRYPTPSTVHTHIYSNKSRHFIDHTRYPAAPNMVHMQHTHHDISDAKKKRLVVEHPRYPQQPPTMVLSKFLCTGCGTDASPEWRTGPYGPRSLCNACGIRYAKGKQAPRSCRDCGATTSPEWRNGPLGIKTYLF